MKKIILGIVFFITVLLLVFFIFKNKNEDDNIKNNEKSKTIVTKKEKISTEKKEEDIMDGITLNYHASIRIEKDNKVFYFDPYKITDIKNDADYIFITHSHYDHFDEDSIKKVMNNNTKFIITNDLEDKILSLNVNSDNIHLAYPTESFEIDNIKVDVIAAYNINSTYHKKSNNWVGYIVSINNIKYYVVGDSDVTDEMKKVSCDVIFIPVGGTYTMDDKQAAEIVNVLKPKYAVPIHYGVVGSKENAKNFVNNLDSSIKGIILN